MVASRQVEIPYHRCVGRQRGRGFGALAQVIGRTAFPFLRKYIVPAARRAGADLLEVAVSEIAEVVERGGRKSFKTAAKSVGKNNWVKGSGKGLQAESFQQNLLNNPVGRKETFLQTFLVEHVKQQFSVPTFCGSVWKSWRESPNCWRCPVLAWTRNLSNYLTWWKLHRVWISNGSELLRRFETVFWHWSSNLWKDVVTIHSRVKEKERSTKMILLFSLKQEQTTTNKKKN